MGIEVTTDGKILARETRVEHLPDPSPLFTREILLSITLWPIVAPRSLFISI